MTFGLMHQLLLMKTFSRHLFRAFLYISDIKSINSKITTAINGNHVISQIYAAQTNVPGIGSLAKWTHSKRTTDKTEDKKTDGLMCFVVKSIFDGLSTFK